MGLFGMGPLANMPAGRHVTASGIRDLHYARIVGTATSGPTEFHTGDCETVLICVRGRAFVIVADESYELAPYDTLYVPRQMDVRVDADGEGCDLVEGGTAVTHDYPVQLVAFEEVARDGESIELVGSNVKTGRICAGMRLCDPAKHPGSAQIEVAIAGGFIWFHTREFET